jgi:hypothetical protein
LPVGETAYRCFVKSDHSRVRASISKRRDFAIRIASVIVRRTEAVGCDAFATFS